MSYDITFRPRREVMVDELQRFCASNPAYHLRADGADYASEDTDVHFTLEWGRRPAAGIEVALPYVRPSVFGLEAGQELARLLACFPCEVDDQQSGVPAFTERQFFESWLACNRTVIRAMRHHSEWVVVPHGEILRVWRWNRCRALEQARWREDLFVPRIHHVLDGGEALTAVAWTDAMPVVLPRVDLVVLVRHELSTRRAARDDVDACVLGWDEILASGAFEHLGGTPDRWLLDHRGEVPRPLRRWFTDRPHDLRGLKLVPTSDVMDAELID